MKLSALILSKNEEDNITECVKSVAFCDEILVIDSGSEDKTRSLAEQEGARVIVNPWPGFALQRDFGIQQCANPWILMVDADERVTPALQEEIRKLFFRGAPECYGYEIPRRTFAFGQEMKHMWPGRSLRLFHKEKGKMTLKRHVHEKILIEGPVGRLKEPMLHYSYRTVGEYIDKMNHYTTLLALQKREEDPGVTGRKAYRRAVGRFWHRFMDKYISRGAFRDGRFGFYLALLTGIQAMTVEFKLMELLEEKRQGKK
ncbi:MAG TPA: glycosyltransferase family 2 protein [Candidatus Mcinerneyibacteriales bacterium]|nr:glycosyltransferase family 2 protein [Candidatus Mcinerneyibacteriales bacterium]